MKKAVFWVLRRAVLVIIDDSKERIASIIRVLRSVLRLPVTANILSSPILVTLMMEVTRSSEMSVLTRATRRHIPESGTLYKGFCHLKR
jgi:hypothetical protein